jgi:hypothetical protein
VALPTVTTRVVGILQMVFINLITTTHGNRTTNQPLMSSMVAKECRSADAMHSRSKYQEPIVVTAPILDHKDSHYVRPNKVTLKYPDFKKDVDPDAHVEMFNSVIKANAKTSQKYIINAFKCTIRDTTSDWCHNYMSKSHDCIFSKLT